jgi:hypothetical protein
MMPDIGLEGRMRGKYSNLGGDSKDEWRIVKVPPTRNNRVPNIFLVVILLFL